MGLSPWGLVRVSVPKHIFKTLYASVSLAGMVSPIDRVKRWAWNHYGTVKSELLGYCKSPSNVNLPEGTECLDTVFATLRLRTVAPILLTHLISQGLSHLSAHYLILFWELALFVTWTKKIQTTRDSRISAWLINKDRRYATWEVRKAMSRGCASNSVLKRSGCQDLWGNCQTEGDQNYSYIFQLLPWALYFFLNLSLF